MYEEIFLTHFSIVLYYRYPRMTFWSTECNSPNSWWSLCQRRLRVLRRAVCQQLQKKHDQIVKNHLPRICWTAGANFHKKHLITSLRMLVRGGGGLSLESGRQGRTSVGRNVHFTGRCAPLEGDAVLSRLWSGGAENQTAGWDSKFNCSKNVPISWLTIETKVWSKPKQSL